MTPPLDTVDDLKAEIQSLRARVAELEGQVKALGDLDALARRVYQTLLREPQMQAKLYNDTMRLVSRRG